LIQKDVVNELWCIQEIKDRQLEMCMDVPFDLKLAKLITRLIRLNKEGLLQSTRQVDLMKDGRRSTKVAKGSDVHVELKGADMLTQKDVSLKELNLLKRKSELARANGKSTVSINKLITSEMDETGMTLDKEESTCQKNSIVAKRNLLPQKINVEHMEKRSGELQKFMMNSKIEMKLQQLLEICPQF
jgi:hypothetical protein